MELELKNAEGKVIGTVALPLESLEERLGRVESAQASLSSKDSSVSKAELQEALAPVFARLRELTDEEKAVLVERVFDHMGRERYIEEGLKRGYITAEEPAEVHEDGSDEELAGVVVSSKDHTGDPGWEYSELLGVWVKEGE